VREQESCGDLRFPGMRDEIDEMKEPPLKKKQKFLGGFFSRKG